MEGRQYLRDMVMTSAPEMSDAVRRVADSYLSGDLRELLALNIRDAAARIGTSESSITRFTRHIGYAGYREFQTELTLALEGIERLFPVYAGVKPGSGMAEIVRCVSAQIVSGISDTMNLVDPDALRPLAQKIAGAERVIIAAGGRSLLAAEGFQHRLSRLGIRAEVTNESYRLECPVSFITERDVLVVFTLWARRKAALNLLRSARSRGAYTAIVTAAAGELTCDEVDLVIPVAPEPRAMAGHTNTTVSEFVVADCVYMLVMDAMGPAVRRTIEHTVQAVKLDRLDFNPGQQVD